MSSKPPRSSESRTYEKEETKQSRYQKINQEVETKERNYLNNTHTSSVNDDEIIQADEGSSKHSRGSSNIKTITSIKEFFSKSKKEENIIKRTFDTETEKLIMSNINNLSLTELEFNDVSEFVDVLWDSKDKPNQAKLLYQSISRYKKEQILGDTVQSLDLNQENIYKQDLVYKSLNERLGENGVLTDRINIEYKSSDNEENKDNKIDEFSDHKSLNPMSLASSFTPK